jgi:tetraacyldisaccharide-1-P 4'-kinase
LATAGKGRLPCTVISVGNITVGGTGKTPVVLYLAQFLVKKGKRPEEYESYLTKTKIPALRGKSWFIKDFNQAYFRVAK